MTVQRSALRLPGFRAFFITYMLAMMADNIEHVISYYVAFAKFHSTVTVRRTILPPRSEFGDRPWPAWDIEDSGPNTRRAAS